MKLAGWISMIAMGIANMVTLTMVEDTKLALVIVVLNLIAICANYKEGLDRGCEITREVWQKVMRENF